MSLFKLGQPKIVILNQATKYQIMVQLELILYPIYLGNLKFEVMVEILTVGLANQIDLICQ